MAPLFLNGGFGLWEVRKSEIKPVENLSYNQQSFLGIYPVQTEVLPSHKLQDHAYEYQILFRLKEDLTKKFPLSHLGFTHRSRMSGEFDSRKDSQLPKFKRRPQIFLNLSFRELCDSRLSDVHDLDNMAIIN